MTYSNKYDIVIVGAGHAGCEAALAASRCGLKVLVLTMDTSATARMSCNPAIGGLAKGHLVREIDALGGEMGKAIDASGIQFRMLNRSKGPAVWSPRAQADKKLYSDYMTHALQQQPCLEYVAGEVIDILIKENSAAGVVLKSGKHVECRAVIITSGTFLGGIGFRGADSFEGGRVGEKPAIGLTKSLQRNGIQHGRFKTGTPPRLDGRTIDWTQFEQQDGDEFPQPFSFSTDSIAMPQIPCYLGWTNEVTHEILREGFEESPLFSGKIQGAGPRYCPSIEDKINRFANKKRHQIFLEPEGLDTNWIYINGYSTSLPTEVQLRGLKSIPGLDHVEVLQYGYAVEYDYFPPDQLHPWMETRAVRNLYLAGQINGTSGYEEAAAQGLIAGINTANILLDKEPLILKRSEAYIGVLIDDLINKPIEEPYRLFTSRAEYRLILRQDNADERLMEYGRTQGLINDTTYAKMINKRESRSMVISYLKSNRVRPENANPVLKNAESSPIKESESLYQLLKRPELSFSHIANIEPGIMSTADFLHGFDLPKQVEMEVKYEGYIIRLNKQANSVKRMEDSQLSDNINYKYLSFLSMEAREKLETLRPHTLGQASRIAGISAADIANLMVYLKKNTIKSEQCST